MSELAEKLDALRQGDDDLAEYKAHLFRMLHRLTVDYQRACEPYVRELAKLKARELPTYIVPHDASLAALAKEIDNG